MSIQSPSITTRTRLTPQIAYDQPQHDWMMQQLADPCHWEMLVASITPHISPQQSTLVGDLHILLLQLIKATGHLLNMPFSETWVSRIKRRVHSKHLIHLGGSPGLVVMGDDTYLRCRGFESHRRILDGHDIFNIDLL